MKRAPLSPRPWLSFSLFLIVTPPCSWKTERPGQRPESRDARPSKDRQARPEAERPDHLGHGPKGLTTAARGRTPRRGMSSCFALRDISGRPLSMSAVRGVFPDLSTEKAGCRARAGTEDLATWTRSDVEHIPPPESSLIEVVRP